MNDSKYLNLLQEQFDVDLSLPQQCALQGYLDGNAQAAQLSQQIQSVVNCRDSLAVPPQYLPRDPEGLHKAIMERLETRKSNLPPVLKWIVLFFSKEPRETDSNGLDRLKKLPPNGPRQMREESILTRSRIKSPAPAEPQHDSLAVLIKKRLKDIQPWSEEAAQKDLQVWSEEPAQEDLQPWSEEPAQKDLQAWSPQPRQMDLQAWSPQPRQMNLQAWSLQHPQMDLQAWSPQPPQMDLQAWSPQPPQPQPQNPQPYMPFAEPVHPHDDVPSIKSPYMVPPVNEFHQEQKFSTVIPVEAISSFIDAIFVDAPKVPPIELPLDQVASLNVELEKEEQIKQDMIARQRSTFAKLNISENAPGTGQITSLGKFLLDPKCERMIESMISGSNRKVTTRVLTEQESADLKECLKPIGDQEGVAGCVVLGYDGFVIANTLPAGCDLDVFSAWALVTYISSSNALDFIGHGRVHQIVSRTHGGIILLADFGQGLLVAVSDKTSTEAVLPLMRGVRKISAA